MLDYFIDSHCHMFTIADIPLHKPIERMLQDNDAPGTYLALPLISFIRPFYNPKRALDHYGPYVRFFESEPEQVVKQLAREVTTAVGCGIEPAQKIVLTPLVMDFDGGAKVTKLRGQADRLKAAIAAATASVTEPFPASLKVLPFLGLNPGRDDIDLLLSQEHGYDVRSVSSRGGIDNVDNGEFVGIKLYPPLGFDVYPENDLALQSRNMAFYSRLAQDGLPVTVHCQKGSFSLVDKETKESFTSPMNWEAVFSKLSPTDQQRFRINFAHFGGDDGVNKTIGFRPAVETDCVLVEQVQDGNIFNTWTYSIVRLLKKYPHTYSDLAAFDFHDEESLICLLWILYFDAIGKFDDFGNYAIVEKLLWGSDYPMILNSDVNGYDRLLKTFTDSFTFGTRSVGKWQYPPLETLPSDRKLIQRDFIRKLVCDNPQKFLFGPA